MAPSTYAIVSIILLLFVTPLDSAAQSTTTGKTATLEQTIGELAFQRSQAEAWAKRLKERFKKTHETYQRSEILYSNARSSIEQYVARVRVGLQTGELSTRNIQLVEPAARDAVATAREFIQFGEAAYYDKAVGAARGSADLVAIVGKLLDTTLLLIDRYLNADAQRRTIVLQELESIRWRQFHEL